ncbi:MAG: FHA domain-containing protein [Candidatus Eisenbacteria bacterium]
MPEPVRGGSPQYAAGVRLALSLKGQLVQNFSFDKAEIKVGRDPYCDVYVDNPGVSREHFRIDRCDTGEYRVTDLGSSNGTYLNDRPVKVGTLRDGDVIQFGKYSLRVGVDELIGDESGVKRHSVAEGATMMLSPSEVRQMVADARSTPAPRPKLAVVERHHMPEPTPIASPGSSRPWMLWIVLGGMAAMAVAAAMLFGR